MWREVLALLAFFATDTTQVDTEPARAAAAVSFARASMEKDAKETGEQPVADPPLVPVEQPTGGGSVDCKDGDCWYTDKKTGRRYRILR